MGQKGRKPGCFVEGKLKYMKPRLEMISFSMSSSIAGSCKFGTPGYQDNGWGLDAWSAELCYHVPAEDLAVFGS